MKKILTVIIGLILLISITGCKTNKNDNELTILTSNFPGYDFARAITKDVPNTSVEMLLKPGTEMHNYEPTPKDIIKISKADIFVYVGGESDEWINDLLGSIDTKNTKLIRLMDLVDTVEEEIVEGMEIEEEEDEEEVEYDEHVWTSPRNDIEIIKGIYNEIIKLDSDNESLYENNANSYIKEFEEIDNEMKRIINESNRNLLVFGDRFAFRYFIKDYNIGYYAAFPGCSSETEASASTISYLIKVVKDNNVPVIIKEEFSNGKIADTIANETNTKVVIVNSGHNISYEQFKSGYTLAEILKNNNKSFEEALK